MRSRLLRLTRRSYLCFGLLLLAACCQAQTYIISTVAGAPSDLYAAPGVPDDVPGPATAAHLNFPIGLALDSTGNLYIADTYNHRIRKVSPQGTLSTFAGTGDAYGSCADGGRYSGDGGPATNALLNCPNGVVVDQAGIVYIADTGNYVIRKVTPDGIISTFAGTGTPGYSGDGGQGANAQFTPSALAMDTLGDLYISDGDAQVIRKIAPGGVITTVAGTGIKGYTGDGGQAISAQLCYPEGIALDKAGNLFIADSGNGVIRKVDASGLITTIAGDGPLTPTLGDGGPATKAEFQNPVAVAVDAAGNLFIADVNDDRIREIRTDGIIVTAAGNPGNVNGIFDGDGGLATNAGIQTPFGVFAQGSNIYVSDTGHNLVRLLTPGTPPSNPAPSISKGGVVPIFSASPAISAYCWISIYGTNLSTSATPVTWNGDYPLSLGGTTVIIDNSPAALSYVSPTQINAYVGYTSDRTTVNVSVTTANGTGTSTVNFGLVSPAFSLLGDGRHVAGIILRNDGSGAFGNGTYDIIGPAGTTFGYPTVPAQAGDTVELFGVGFGPVISVGGVSEATSRVDVTIGNVSVTPAFSGLSSPGLFQFNLVLPSGLGSGDVPLTATVNGSSTQNAVVISVR